MDPLKLIQTVESTVFEIALWVLLLPKTLLQVLRRPSWVVEYTETEFEKPEADRFHEYLSPVLFWLILAVGPYLWGTSVVRHRFSPPGQGSADAMSRVPYLDRYLITAMLLVAAPLTLAVIFARIRGHGVARKVLRQHFAAQCYLQTPTLLCAMPVAVGLMFAPRAQLMAHLNRVFTVTVVAAISVLWLLAAETSYVKRDLNTGSARALSIALGGLLMGGAIVAALLFGAAHGFRAAHLLLPEK